MVGAFGEAQVMDWGLANVLPQRGTPDEPSDESDRTAVSVIRTVRSGSDADRSRAGSVLGTPSYMAPEQARGDIDAIDERTDVFGLGSILCEILTGQPAFTGPSRDAILRRARRAETADALARLDACGADADMKALACNCLAVEPDDRPRDAVVLAAAITAYLAGVQEKLRMAEVDRVEARARAEEETKRRLLADDLAREAEARAVEERTRRRVTVGLAASVLALVASVGAGYGWFRWQRNQGQSRFDLALRGAEALRSEAKQAGDDLARFATAREAARAIARLLADARDQPSRERVKALEEAVEAEAQMAESDQELVGKLVDMCVHNSASDPAYADAFRKAGIDIAAWPGAEVVAAIRLRPPSVVVAMAAALDNWTLIRRERMGDRAGANALSDVAEAVDPDSWRNQLRDALDLPEKEQRLDALRGLARSAKIDELSPVSLDLLGGALRGAGDLQAAERVLRLGQRRCLTSMLEVPPGRALSDGPDRLKAGLQRSLSAPRAICRHDNRIFRRRASVSPRLAGVPIHGLIMRGPQPSLGGLDEVGLDLLQGFVLGVTAWQRRHLGRIPANLGFGVDHCRQADAELNWYRGGAFLHGSPPRLILYSLDRHLRCLP
jgi:serine/threonine-protein kinase